MAVTRKTKHKDESQDAQQDTAAFEAYLNKGGSRAQTQPEAPPKTVRFSLTIPGRLCEQIDTLREAEPINTSRHKWVLEAIVQRMQREAEQE